MVRVYDSLCCLGDYLAVVSSLLDLQIYTAAVTVAAAAAAASRVWLSSEEDIEADSSMGMMMGGGWLIGWSVRGCSAH